MSQTVRTTHQVPPETRRRLVVQEVWLVFALSLGFSGVRALVSFVGSLTAGRQLSAQTAVLNGSRAPGRPWLDLTYQLLAVASDLVPVLLVLHLLLRSGEGPSTIGFDLREKARDLRRGASLAVLIGGSGLVFYLATFRLGTNLTVVAANLPAVWWRYPVLVLSAAGNGLIEEVLVLGYLLHRLRQLGWSDDRALAISSVVRGSYHLYQGVGGFAGNMIMGLVFGRAYQRWGRCMPLVIAHTLIDVVAFVGYTALAGRVSWLPAG